MSDHVKLLINSREHCKTNDVVPYLQGSRCILSGDHLQLPPTIQSVEAEKKGLGKTLFERLADLYGDEIMSMLTVQYRMHEQIMNWSSGELYENKVLVICNCWLKTTFFQPSLNFSIL